MALTTAAVLEGPANANAAGGGAASTGAMLLTGALVAKWTLRVVFVLLVARVLGPKQFGVYALLYTVVEFLAVASGSGYADFLTREAAKDARLGWGLAFQLTALRIAIAIPVAAIEIGILKVLHYSPAVMAGAAWLAVSMAPRSFSEAVQGTLRGIRHLGAYLAIEVALGGTLAAGAVLLYVRHGGLRAAIGVEIVAAFAACAGAAILAGKYKTRQTAGLGGWRFLKTSAIFNVYSFTASLYDRCDVPMLSKLAGDYATGIYSVAYRALGMTQILAYGVLYSLLPALSADPRGVEQRRRLENALALLLGVACAAIVATMVLAGPAVRVLLGIRYAESASALKILIWAVILKYMNCALNISLLAAGREKVFVVTSAVCLAVNVIGNLVFIPLYSWRGAAAMTLVTESVLLAQNLYWVRRARGTTPQPWGMFGNCRSEAPRRGAAFP